LDAGFCQELRELGCVQLSIGYETGDQGLLDQHDKGVDLSDVETAFSHLTSAGVAVNIAIMDGFDSGAAGTAATRDFLAARRRSVGLDTLQLLVIEPGSRLWDRRTSLDSPLSSNSQLAFAGGRHGWSHLAPAEMEASRERLLRLGAEVVPESEAAIRPDLVGEPGSRTSVGPIAAGRLRAGVGIVRDGDTCYLADFAWPALVQVPAQIEVGDGSGLSSGNQDAQRWLGRVAHRRLIVVE